MLIMYNGSGLWAEKAAYGSAGCREEQWPYRTKATGMGTGKELQTPQDTSEDRLQLERGSKGNKDTLLSLGSSLPMRLTKVLVWVCLPWGRQQDHWVGTSPWTLAQRSCLRLVQESRIPLTGYQVSSKNLLQRKEWGWRVSLWGTGSQGKPKARSPP